jgi:glutamate racemase
MKKPIGIYDSGVGGFTVLRELILSFPHEDFIYFADTAHLPYGDKSPEQIISYSHNITSWFQNEMNAKMVIAACNTSSALALDHLNFNIPIIGTIYPLLSHIMESASLGIIATPASAKSRMHENIFIKNGFEGNVTCIECPDFVPLIESGKFQGAEIENAARQYLKEFEAQNIDTLIYGCTHYPFIKNIIKNILPKNIKYIDPAHYISLEVQNLISRPSDEQQGSIKFYCSSEQDVFESKIKRLMNVKHPFISLKKLS